MEKYINKINNKKLIIKNKIKVHLIIYNSSNQINSYKNISKNINNYKKHKRNYNQNNNNRI